MTAPPHVICRLDANLLEALLADEDLDSSMDAGQTAPTRATRSAARLVEYFFSSAGCLNAAFIDHPASYKRQDGEAGPVSC